jgi:hypothetical protein
MHNVLAGSILITIVLLGINAMPNGSSGSGSSSAVTVISATVLPYVEVSAPDNICIWELQPSEPGIYTKKGVIKVTANTEWKVRVKPTDEANNGRMTEWMGTSYASKELQAPLKISADREVTLQEGGIIQTGKTVGEHDIEVKLIQVVSKEDLPLENGHVYRIALSFEGSPME